MNWKKLESNMVVQDVLWAGSSLIQLWWNFEDCHCCHKSHYCSLFWARSNELTFWQLLSFNIHFYVVIIIMIMFVSQVGYFL